MLQIIALLRGQTSWNARRLADHFHVCQRNVYRDLAVMELAGVPYYYDPDFGEGGGYRIRPDWFFPTVQLTQQEAIDLAVLTRGAETGRGIPLLDSACEVRDKLLATVPAEHQDTIREASDLFDIFSLRMADHSSCRKVMIAFQQALLSHRQVEGRYESVNQGKIVKVRLQPRRVFLAGNAWYAACYDNASRKTKLYRLARFEDLQINKDPMTIGPEFSLREFLGNAWTVYRGERDWHVEILFDRETAPLVSEVRWHATQKLLPQKNGSLIFRATVSGLEEIKYWILNWGPRAKVLKPKELAEVVQSLAEATLKHYCTTSEGNSSTNKGRKSCQKRGIAGTASSGN